MITEQQLRNGLKARVFGSKVFTFDAIDSTNNCAKAVAGCGAVEGTVVLAEHQTAGRGRLGRVWQSAPNENLMFSLVLRPRLPQQALNLLPLYVAVAVANAIERTTGIRTECKWPNDLLLGGKKLAGILIESSLKQGTVDYVVVGIGINVNQTGFPDDIQQKATSLRLHTSKEIDRIQLLREILHSLEQTYFQAAPTGFQSILPEWLSHTSMINKPISIAQGDAVISGIVKGLSPDGGLVLQTDGADKTVFAGDVTILRS